MINLIRLILFLLMLIQMDRPLNNGDAQCLATKGADKIEQAFVEMDWFQPSGVIY